MRLAALDPNRTENVVAEVLQLGRLPKQKHERALFNRFKDIDLATLPQELRTQLEALDPNRPEAVVAEAVVAEPAEEVAEAVVAEPAEEVVLDTIQDAVDAENIAKEAL